MRLLRWSILCVFTLTTALPNEGKKLRKVVKIRPKDGNGEETSLVLRDGRDTSFSGFGDRVQPKSKKLDLTSFKNDRGRTESKTTTAVTTRRTLTTISSTIPSTERATTELSPAVVTTRIVEPPRQRTTTQSSTTTVVPEPSTKKPRKNKKKSRNRSKKNSTSPSPTTVSPSTVSALVVEDLSASEEDELDNLKLLDDAVDESAARRAAFSQTTTFTETVRTTTSPVPRNSENIGLALNADILRTPKAEQTEPRLSHNVFVFEKPPPSFSVPPQFLEPQSSNQYSTTERLPEVNVPVTSSQGHQTFVSSVTTPAVLTVQTSAYKEAAAVNQGAFTTTTVQPPTSVSAIIPVIVPVQPPPPASAQQPILNTQPTLPFVTTRQTDLPKISTQDPPKTEATYSSPRPTTTVFTQSIRTTSQPTNLAVQSAPVSGIGSQQQDKPFDLLAVASKFSCTGRVEGYYADINAECKAWHWCTPGDRKFTFTCPNGTRFNQKHQVCDWRSNVKCSNSAEHYPKKDEES